MKWSDLLLGFFAALGPLTASLLYYRQTKAKKELDLSQQQVGIKIDETTHNKLIQEAANINQEREERREKWWGDQIGLLRQEIESERQLSNRRFRRLNQLEDWATRHMAWDRKAWTIISENDPEFEQPPMLPDEARAEIRYQHHVVEHGSSPE